MVSEVDQRLIRVIFKIWCPSKFLIDFSPNWKLEAGGRQKYVQKEARQKNVQKEAGQNYVQRAPYSSQSRPPILCRRWRPESAKRSLNRRCAGHLVSATAGSRRPPKVRPKRGRSPPELSPKGALLVAKPATYNILPLEAAKRLLEWNPKGAAFVFLVRPLEWNPKRAAFVALVRPPELH
jgi:hypothetical protein